MDGDFFIGAALSATLTKLALRYAELENDKVNIDFLFSILLLFNKIFSFSVNKIV